MQGEGYSNTDGVPGNPTYLLEAEDQFVEWGAVLLDTEDATR